MLLLCLLLFPIISAQEEGYSFVSKEIRTPLDHFSFSKNNTFLLRYMVNDTFYKPNGPIFFYTGGNENLEVFAQDSGFIFEIAPQFDALIVFAEHRYYGDSLPFGLFSPPEYMGYLSSIQVLADFADLITFLQKNLRHVWR
ncbi:hypothetical protein NQ315_007082 [Exocentrus adspersus]|uniref:Lysosomal Pro-X carboxypeptidase n=1 Tax=Exocentrus adspersus TaxID=1586481 RepID=A0AAV8WCM9_9CUCU|nr:hypothetical protein NQ315_007082 [Exocentrus adspersus]